MPEYWKLYSEVGELFLTDVTELLLLLLWCLVRRFQTAQKLWDTRKMQQFLAKTRGCERLWDSGFSARGTAAMMSSSLRQRKPADRSVLFISCSSPVPPLFLWLPSSLLEALSRQNLVSRAFSWLSD